MQPKQEMSHKSCEINHGGNSIFSVKEQKCVNQIKVLHLLRDPRGKLNSYDNCCGFNYSDQKRVFQMCERQMKDVEIRNQLENLYPGILMEVQYEHLAADIFNVSDNIYSFWFKSKLPYSVKKWIQVSRNAISGHRSNFNTNRKDPKGTSLAWKKEISSPAD